MKKSPFITHIAALTLGVIIGTTSALIPLFGNRREAQNTVTAYDLTPTPPEVQETARGSVVEKTSSEITLELPSGKQLPVTISDSTEVLKLANKPIEEFQKEQQAFDPESAGENLPPSPYTEEQVSVGDIPLNSNVLVQAQENIIGKERVTAVRITINE